MRFLELQLRAVGPFTGASLDLSGGERGLHVIYGPNEAGKSSTLRALRYLLFGFPGTLDDDFVHRYQDLRVGGVLKSDAGERLEIVRRKAVKQSLRCGNDATPVEEAELRRFLGNVEPGQFATFFGIDHQALVDGGKSLLEGKGNVGEILFSASGISDLHAVQKRIDRECADLYKPQAQKPVINLLLSQHKSAEGAAASLQLRPDVWDEHQKKLEDLNQRKAQVEGLLQEKRRERARLDRIQKGRRLAPERERWRAELAVVADAVLLAADFRDRRQALQQEIAVDEARRARARETVEQYERQLSEVEVPQSLLAQRENIIAIGERIGVYRGAMRDRPDLEAECRRHEAEARSGLQALDNELSLERAAEVRISETQRSKIRALASRYENLAGQRETWSERVAVLSAQLEAARRELESLPAPRDVAALEAAVQTVTRQGDVDEQLDESRQELQRAERRVQAEVARIPQWSGTIDAFVLLRVPHVDSVERMDDELSGLEQELASLRERIAVQQAALDSNVRECESLQQMFDVPSESELQEARRQRERAWELLRPILAGQGVDPAGIETLERETHLRGELSEIYQSLVEAADDTSDRLRREAAHVARRAELERRRGELEAELSALARDQELAAERLEEARDEWRRLWEPAGIDPWTPRDMRQFLIKHGEIVQRFQSLDELRGRIESLETKRSEQVALLRRRLSEAGGAADASATRGELLALAERIVAAASEAAGRRNDAEREVLRLERDLDAPDGARSRLAAAQAGQETWRNEWRGAIADLPVRSDAAPETARADLDRIAQLQDSLRHADSGKSRIEAIDRECQDFEKTVRSLAKGVDAALGKLPVEQAAAEMHGRLRTQALKADERVQLLRQKCDEERRRDEEGGARLSDLQSKLALLVREAGCRSPAELAEAESRSQARRTAEERLDQCETQLLDLCGTAPLDEFVAAECRAADADAILAEIARADAEIAGQERVLTDEISVQIGAVQHAVDQIDSSGKAAEEKEKAQDLAARLAIEAEEFARLKLAQIVLKRGIERYRERHQGPILSRASEIFASLTCGSFSGLREDFGEDGKPVLVGIRTASGQPVGVGRMSDGTADQIYLAVRLAWLEEFLSRHESVPFIVDDVLIRFDDDRAIETLRALADLSRKTQVLFFTHHRHLLDLAREKLPADDLFTHELPCGAPASVVPAPHVRGAGSTEGAARTRELFRE